MSKLYNQIQKEFTITPNELINDEAIDARARFLFVWLCSKPADWKYYNTTIERALGVAKDTRLKLMRELVKTGWISIEQLKDDNGQFDANTIVLNPRPIKPTTVPKPKTSATDNNGGGQNQPHNNKNSIQKKNSNNTKKDEPTLFGNETFLPADVLNHLNQRLIEKNKNRRGFAVIDSNLKYIKALLKNKVVNYTLNDFKAVIDYKVNEWSGKEKTEKWLRPKTLFGDKFDSYLTIALNKRAESSGDNNYVEAIATQSDLL